jgi:hypothetical protein
MNLTISIDDKLLEEARKLARSQGTSLQELLRRYIRSLSDGNTVAAGRELLELMHTDGGHSGGRRIARAEAYQGRV